jgi:tetratricopeptide (TPR) repeat protein
MGQYEAALADFSRALELDPNDAWDWAHRGETYRQMGQYEAALADFSRALELDPNNDWILYGRALLYHVLDCKEKALADLNIAIQYSRQLYEKDPQHWQNTFNLSLYYLAAGEVEKAKLLYTEALSSGASTHSILEALGDLNDFLILFPNHTEAQSIQKQLHSISQSAGDALQIALEN